MGGGSSKSKIAAKRIEKKKEREEEARVQELKKQAHVNRVKSESTTYSYRVLDENDAKLRVAISKKVGKPLPTVGEIKTEISNMTHAPLGCIMLRKVIIDWEKELDDDSLPMPPDEKSRLAPGFRYAFVPEERNKKTAAKIKKLCEKPGKFDLAKFNKEGAYTREQIEQYFYYSMKENQTAFDRELCDDDILTRCLDEDHLRLAACIVDCHSAFSPNVLEHIPVDGTGQNVFIKACIKDPDIAMSMLDRKALTRTALNCADVHRGGALHIAMRRGHWALASKIIMSSNVERWTLQGKHNITKQNPIEIAWEYSERTQTTKGYYKIKEMLEHKIEKLYQRQNEKKVGVVGEKTAKDTSEVTSSTNLGFDDYDELPSFSEATPLDSDLDLGSVGTERISL